MALRLVGTSRGDGFDPHAVSGTARALFDALAVRYPLVDRVDVDLSSPQRALVGGLAFSPDRQRWRQRYWLSPLGFALMSWNCRRALAGREDADVAVQVHGMFRTGPLPYFIVIDTTSELAFRHWPESSPFTSVERRARHGLERRAYKAAARLFPWSANAADSLVDFYGVPRHRVTVTGGGSHFYPLPALRPRTREPVLLFVGREWRRKGGPQLLEAFRAVRARVPAARLVIVGTDEPRPEPGVEVLGTVADRGRMAGLYAGATLFTMPSLFEPWGHALTEAMAFGLPCVSTRVGGIPEIVRDGETGVLVAPGDVPGLAQALLRILEDVPLGDRLGAAGRHRVESELTWNRVVDRMVPALQALTTRRRDGWSRPRRLRATAGRRLRAARELTGAAQQ